VRVIEPSVKMPGTAVEPPTPTPVYANAIPAITRCQTI